MTGDRVDRETPCLLAVCLCSLVLCLYLQLLVILVKLVGLCSPSVLLLLFRPAGRPLVLLHLLPLLHASFVILPTCPARFSRAGTPAVVEGEASTLFKSRAEWMLRSRKGACHFACEGKSTGNSVNTTLVTAMLLWCSWTCSIESATSQFSYISVQMRRFCLHYSHSARTTG